MNHSRTPPPDFPSPGQILDLLDRIPRHPLAMTPTPLLPVPALAGELGLPDDGLLLKLDAWTGFGLGGNKVRKLEYELAPRRMERVTCLITSGGPQSNHCRVTAAAAAHLGLDCILVLNGPLPERPSGNALLHRILGAEVRTVQERDQRDMGVSRAAAEVAAKGGLARIIPLGASTPLGALGYARAALEFLQQVDGGTLVPGTPFTVVVASSSGGTLAGLILGFHLAGRLGPETLDSRGRGMVNLLAVSADVSAGGILDTARTLAQGALELIRKEASAAPLASVPDIVLHALARTIPHFTADPAAESGVRATQAFVGEGYGIPTPEGNAAQALFGSRGGVILDPVYTAKAGAALVEMAATSRGVGRMVFWHTGGHPAALT
ncbi:MAG: pyridoxal-phosphate dependent enzyme [Gemmatimonadota bacterium]